MPASASARAPSRRSSLDFGFRVVLRNFEICIGGEASWICLELVPQSFIIHCWSDVSGIGLGPINTSGDALNPIATRYRVTNASQAIKGLDIRPPL